ncbi:hypothetical protein [Deinococcus apachensis]|uniref:hypothetical protein n=1 Tax=Deinococcus apachensis TaxID=309886 RepID=UPI000367A9BA|nr:hypothetical protein [Deinococcus apachensis]
MPVVRVSTPAESAVGPSWASYEPEPVLAELRLSPGARRVFLVLHRLALDVARERAYRLLPDSVTFHVPALMVAGLTGYTDRHLRRLAGELEQAGVLDAGGHASRVGLRSLYDGTLWAVKVKPGDTAPRLRAEDWKHAWRPTFAADVEGKRGAARVMSELQTAEASEGERYRAVLRAAVAPDAAFTPVASSSDMTGAEAEPRTVREVIYRLGELAHVHPSQRPGLVGRMASALAHALGDLHSRRWYCSLIWQAWEDEVEGRPGLQGLAAQLSRLAADLVEWPGIRSPGALLATRLRSV